MCGTRPSGHAASSNRSSSAAPLGTSMCDQPMAEKAESQFHWWGYRCGEGRQ